MIKVHTYLTLKILTRLDIRSNYQKWNPFGRPLFRPEVNIWVKRQEYGNCFQCLYNMYTGYASIKGVHIKKETITGICAELFPLPSLMSNSQDNSGDKTKLREMTSGKNWVVEALVCEPDRNKSDFLLEAQAISVWLKVKAGKRFVCPSIWIRMTEYLGCITRCKLKWTQFWQF